MTRIMMSSSVLLKALKSIAFAHNPAAAKSVPVVECVRLQVSENKLRMDTTDLNLQGRVSIEVESTGSAVVCIPFVWLRDLLVSLPEQPVTMNIDGKSLQLLTDNGKYRQTGREPEEWPKETEFKQKSIMISSGRLLELINAALPFCSKQENMPAMTGVSLKITADELMVRSSDGYVLCNRVVALTDDDWGEDGKPEAPIEVIVSNRQAKAMVAVHSPSPYIQLAFSSNAMRAENIGFAGLTITGQLIDKRYPSFEAIIGQTNKTLTIGRADLMGTLSRINLVTDSVEHKIRLSMGRNLLTVAGEDIKLEKEGKEDLLCDYADDQLDINVNLNTLVTCLKSFETPMIQINALAANKPLHIRPADLVADDPNVSLLIPIQYKN